MPGPKPGNYVRFLVKRCGVDEEIAARPDREGLQTIPRKHYLYIDVLCALLVLREWRRRDFDSLVKGVFPVGAVEELMKVVKGGVNQRNYHLELMVSVFVLVHLSVGAPEATSTLADNEAAETEIVRGLGLEVEKVLPLVKRLRRDFWRGTPVAATLERIELAQDFMADLS